MTHVVLGLLLLRAMSLYDVLRAIESGISLFYAASAGSVKRALDQLLDRGDIVVASEESTGRKRKTYAITEQGEATFREWLRADLEAGNVEAVVLPRVYFLEFLTPEERVEVLERMRDRLARDAEALDHVDASGDGEAPPDSPDLPVYARAVLDYGVRAHRVGTEWIEELLSTTQRMTAEA